MSTAERWAERAWERITRRIVRRIAVLESDGLKMSTGALILHNLTSYRDLAYMTCLRAFLRRESQAHGRRLPGAPRTQRGGEE